MGNQTKYPPSPTKPLPVSKREEGDEFNAGEFSDLEEPMPRLDEARKANEKAAKRFPSMSKFLKRLMVVFAVGLFYRR